jgi:hypothetical protein
LKSALVIGLFLFGGQCFASSMTSGSNAGTDTDDLSPAVDALPGNADALPDPNSVDSTLQLSDGQTISVTPGSGTLTITYSGVPGLQQGTNLTVNGSVTNNGTFAANYHDSPGVAGRSMSPEASQTTAACSLIRITTRLTS